MSLPKLNLLSGCGGKAQVLDMQRFFSSAPIVKMHLKSVVVLLPWWRPLGALPPPLAPVSVLFFFPPGFSTVKAFDSQKGQQVLYFPCLAKSGFLCYFEHFILTCFPMDWSSPSQLLFPAAKFFSFCLSCLFSFPNVCLSFVSSAHLQFFEG